MNAELLIFPCLVIALYFEVFVLVTFLSAPARAGRARTASTSTPRVAIVVPCFNEASTVAGTARSLLALEYPKDRLQIVLVNDGSTDGTKEAMEEFRGNPQVTIVHKENGGKHTAINAGIEIAEGAEIVGCLDADSFVAPDALREIIASFDNPKVAASTAAMSVHKPHTIIEHMQNAEYILGIALRHILASVNGLYVTPGPFSLYRRDIVRSLGGFRHAHQAEDMEMALRMQRAGLIIENAPRARVYTKAPRSIPRLIKQRTRWTTGFLRNVLYEYRDLVGNPQYGVLGVIVLPMAVFALVSGMALFGIVIIEIVRQVVSTLLIINGVPLSYFFSIRPFEWFFLPITNLALLTIVVLFTVGGLTLIGKFVSKTEGKIGLGLFAHAFIYGLVAPLWIIRAVADVATGTRRSWR
jgi:cellulose synthase/poly-beta-1,6-N-acetylglucosamine synthase-like glycosyltransferase